MPSIRWNHAALRLLLLNPKTSHLLAQRGKAIADACGGDAAGFVVRVSPVGSRARVAVIAMTNQARRKNERENTLLNHLDAGRG